MAAIFWPIVKNLSRQNPFHGDANSTISSHAGSLHIGVGASASILGPPGANADLAAIGSKDGQEN
jgi:hypothetical protein